MPQDREAKVKDAIESFENIIAALDQDDLLVEVLDNMDHKLWIKLFRAVTDAAGG